MPIRPNEGQIHAGASSIITPPISDADCVKFPTFEQLVTEEQKADRGCSIRAGEA